MTGNLIYYFTADLRDSAGTTIGQAFLVVPVPEPGTLSIRSGALGLLRRRRG